MDFKNKTDEELMVLYISGSIHAFDEIYKRYARKIFGYFKNKTGSVEVAEELSQEFFVKIHRKRDLFTMGYRLSPWLFTIAKNMLVDHFLRNKEVKYDEINESDILSFPDTSYVDMEDLRAAIKRLPKTSKKVVNLRYFKDMGYDEISEILGKTPVNIRKILSRAVFSLRASYEGV